jgi:predicted TIM-barrel fold metal-dependent hydrolase
MARSYKMISGDSHLDIVPERWRDRVPERWRDRAPRLIQLPNGNDAFIVEGRPPHSPGLQITGTGTDYASHDTKGISYVGPGTGTPEKRLEEQTQDGVDAEIMYTHPSYLNSWRGIRDNEPYLACIHAYNEWLVEEYCAVAPDRLIAMGLIPDTGIDDAIAELEYCAKAGFKGVCIYKFPNGKGFPKAEDDRFWAAALDLNMPVTQHTNGGTTRFQKDGPVFDYGDSGADAVPGRDPLSLMMRFSGDMPMAPLQMAYAGVFDRFPKLKIYWGESQAGWLPYSFHQIDDNYERNRYWAERLHGLKPMKRKPSEYLRDQNLWGFMKDAYAVSVRHEIGVDSLVWGSDFAHATGDWPESLKMINETFVGVPDDERYKMLAGNAIDFFHLDVD